MRRFAMWLMLLPLLSYAASMGFAPQCGGRPCPPPTSKPTPASTNRKPNGRITSSNNKNNKRPAPSPTPRKVTAQLTIKSIPLECQVILNNKLVGSTDASGEYGRGSLILKNLEPGQYSITVQKEGYRGDGQRTIELKPGQKSSIEINLFAIPGTLTIKPSVAGTNINISNMGSYGEVVDLPIAPGLYYIEVSKPGYQIAKLTHEPLPAKSMELTVTLEPLPTQQALAQAEQYFRSKDYDTAAAISEVVLTTHPDNMQAIVLMSYSHYYAGRFDLLTKALAANQQIVIPIKRYQRISSGDDLISGQLVLRRGSIGFKSTEASGFDVTVAANKIYVLNYEAQKRRIYASVGINQGSSKKEKKEKLYFHPTTSVVNIGRKSTIECSTNCQQELQAIFRLIHEVKP